MTGKWEEDGFYVGKYLETFLNVGLYILNPKNNRKSRSSAQYPLILIRETTVSKFGLDTG